MSKIRIVASDGGLIHEAPEYAKVRVELDGGGEVTITVDKDEGEGITVRETSSLGLAIRTIAGNTIRVVPVRHTDALQVPRMAEPFAVASALEVQASNALHGFRRGSDAQVRLNELVNDLYAYARRIREAAGDPQAVKDREEYEAGLLNAGATDGE